MFFMEYRTVSAKLPSNEFTMFRAFCEKKRISPAKLIRKAILQEMKIPIPHTIAGKNRIFYDDDMDLFTWVIELDNGEQIDILKNVSPEFIENLHEIITLGLGERNSFIHKEKKESVPIPSDILRGKNE